LAYKHPTDIFKVKFPALFKTRVGIFFVYFDDILVASYSLEENILHLERVSERLEEAG